MIKKPYVLLGILLTCLLQTGELAAQSGDAEKAMGDAKGMVQDAKEKMAEGGKEMMDGAKEKMMGSGNKEGAAGSGSKGVVYLNETFDSQTAGSQPAAPELQRVKLMSVADGGGKVGSGMVAHFNDNDDEAGGAMEYNVGESALGSMYVEFDALNNNTGLGDKNSAVIFGVGPWEEGSSLTLNSKSKRAFGFEMYQQKNLRLRVGDASISKLKYDSAAKFNVKIWANDNDSNTLSYKRPDTGETAELGADSVVVWVNNALMPELQATGVPMHKEVTEGDAVIGRAGLSSASTKVADFLFDNLKIADPTGESKPAAPSAGDSSSTEKTPSTLPGAETMSYREGENSMNLFVFKPEGWKAEDKRSAFVFFSAEAGLAVLR